MLTLPSWFGFYDRSRLYSINSQTIAIQYETSDSATYIRTNNDRCPNFRNSTEESKNPKQTSKTEKLVQIVIKDKNSTLFGSPEGLIEGIQEFKENKKETDEQEN